MTLLPKLSVIFRYTFVFFLIVSFWILLWSQKEIVSVPNSDFFLYLNNSREYLEFRLPANIKIPPFTPIVLGLVSKFFQGRTVYPEFVAAQLINITFAALILAITFFLLNSLSPVMALATVILLASNQTYFLTSLNITNDVVYGFFLCFVLLLYHRNHPRLAYFVAGLSITVRYESVVLSLSLLLVDLFTNRQSVRSRLPFFLVPLALYFVILNFHSQGVDISQNSYFIQIAHDLKSLPNLKPFQNLLTLITYNPFFDLRIGNYFGFTIVFLAIWALTRFHLPRVMMVAYLTFLLQLLLLSIFPSFSIRYLFSITWILYLIVVNQPNIFLRYILIFFLLGVNLSRLNYPRYFSNIYDKSEYRLASDWINQNLTESSTKVLIYEPWVLDYFLVHPRASVEYEGHPGQNINSLIVNCQNQLLCVAQQLKSKYSQPTNLLVVTTTSSATSLDPGGDVFINTQNFATPYQQFPQPNDLIHFRLVTTLGDNFHWAKIYIYEP